MRARRTDSNQKLIVAYRRRWILVEVKSKNGKLGPTQEAWIEQFNNGGEVHVARDAADVPGILGL